MNLSEQRQNIDRALAAAGVLPSVGALEAWRGRVPPVVLESTRLVLAQLLRAHAELLPPTMEPGASAESLSLLWQNEKGEVRILIQPRGDRLGLWAYAAGKTVLEGNLPRALVPAEVLDVLVPLL